MADAWKQRRGFSFRGARMLGLAVLAGLAAQGAFAAEPAKLRVLIQRLQQS